MSEKEEKVEAEEDAAALAKVLKVPRKKKS